MGKLRRAIGLAKHCRFWKRGHSRYLLAQKVHRDKNSERAYTDRDHMIAAAEWLARAQDATPDGGVVGRYRLNIGWTSTYPETTGYIIPTFLDLSVELDNPRFKERARRAVEFLLSIQLHTGAFPGLEIAENRDEPSPFNTAQIINGLVTWARTTGDHNALEAAKRAGDWLISIQDDDGAWRKHYYYGVVPTYATHIACWLAQLGQYTGERKYLDAASRNIDWALSQRVEETGWIEHMGFDANQHEGRVAYTHTIAYTLWGILYTS
jgi:squalene cyclase